MKGLQRLQRQLDFDSRGQGGHSLVIHVVVIAESGVLPQVGPGSLSGGFCSPHFRIVHHLVFQLPPFDKQPASINFLAKRLLFKSLVELRYLWKVGSVGLWIRRGRDLRLLLGWIKIDSRWRGILVAQCQWQAAQQRREN